MSIDNSIQIWTFDTQDDIHIIWELVFHFKQCINVSKILLMQKKVENFFLSLILHKYPSAGFRSTEFNAQNYKMDKQTIIKICK